MQLAAYLVQEHTAQELVDSQQLAEFNKRVTFALHDLKNTSGQLSLLLHNAERFGDDAAFQADMMLTIRHAVDNLQGLIAKLRGEDRPTDVKKVGRTGVDICELVAQFAARKSKSGVVIGREKDGAPIFAAIAQPGVFENALEHVVANALEASPVEGSVGIDVDQANGRVRVRVTDNGPGMTADFIAHEMFRPLRTTKKKGLGIGAYQARAMMRDLGGDIEVESKPGKGTTVSLFLPAAKATEDRKTP
jgi:putative PEP-CTERM system histidine kinase